MKLAIEIVLTKIGICVLTLEYGLLTVIRNLAKGPNPYSLGDFLEGRVSGRKLVFG
jgi:hypothetical protein